MTNELNRILYVEDDEDIAEITIMTLEDIGGFDVRHCSSGTEALEVYPDFGPQLVLMDMMMPHMDGKETFRRLKALPGAADTPVIFVTAKVQTHEQIAYLEMGALGVVMKPFDPMALCGDISEMWKQRDA